LMYLKQSLQRSINSPVDALFLVDSNSVNALSHALQRIAALLLKSSEHTTKTSEMHVIPGFRADFTHQGG